MSAAPPLTARLTVTLLLLALLAPCSAGPVYKSVGPDGKVTYSDTPPASDSEDVSKDLRAKDASLRVDPAKAAMQVYVKEVIVETAYRFCRDEVPESAGPVREARDRWMQRHAQLRARKILVLKDRMTTDELRQLARQAQEQNEGILRTMKQAPLAERTKWCTAAPKTFAAPEFDLAGKPELVDAIMNYHVRQN
ncbi:MAG TPA: DUF4124 domain-containing protein [Steroidobacteraceae bacterium]|nr:DUF4124 domain-containing protein [Steroidobacteraceae bacterium]